MSVCVKSTKIVATLGPSTNSAQVIEKLISAGVDVVRMNFSHGSSEDHIKKAALVHETASRLSKDVGVLVDLQGPKIRVGKFENGQVDLKVGQSFSFDTECEFGDESRVGLDYKELVKDVDKDDILLLNDGQVSMRVKSVTKTTVDCTVVHGGILSDRKGINRQGGGLSAPALTHKDREDILTAAAIGADYLAVSFPKSAEDMIEARRLLNAAGSKAWTIAKIERIEAIENMKTIYVPTGRGGRGPGDGRPLAGVRGRSPRATNLTRKCSEIGSL